MSYRTTVNGEQLFGNNECYTKWIDFIKSQGIEVDGDYCYSGEIVDVDKALDVLEDITSDVYEKYNKHLKKNLYDLSETVGFWTKGKSCGQGIYDALSSIVECSYMFVPYYFIQLCGDSVEEYIGWADDRRFHRFRIKDGCKITVKAG